MTNEQMFNWWKPYIGEKIHHKSHIEFKGLIVNYDTSWNKFKVKVTEWIDLNEAYLFYYLEIKDVKDYCGELSDLQTKYEREKRKAWQEDYSDVTWEDFNENYIQCERCKTWDTTQCICYAR